jgi:hypothetical protein
MTFKERARKIIDSYDWEKDLFVLPPQIRVKLMLEIAEFVEPKLQRQEIKTDTSEITIRVVRE